MSRGVPDTKQAVIILDKRMKDLIKFISVFHSKYANTNLACNN